LNVYNLNYSKKKFNFTLKNKIKKIIIKILYINTKIKIDFHKMFAKQFSSKKIFIRSFFFLTEKKINEKKIDREKYSSFFFKLPLSKNFKKKIIYIDSGDEEMIGDEFKKIVHSIFKIAEQAKFHIIIKKPIIENLSPCLSGYSKYSYISDQIPIELYDLRRVHFVFGFMSTALVKVSEINTHTKVFSIVNLLSSKKIKEFQKIIYSFHSGLNRTSAKINYPTNLTQVQNIIDRKNI
jgi:hypothetical protein